MVESVSYLQIMPVCRYQGSENKKTTASAFDSLLKTEMESASVSEDSNVSKSGVELANSTGKSGETTEQKTTAATESSRETSDEAHTEGTGTADNSSAINFAANSAADSSNALYRDAETGKEVIYVDVADNPDRLLQMDSSSKITSASSMRTTKYNAYFKEAAQKYGVSESLLKGIAKAESNFNPKDVSSTGAVGVMQLMPATAREFGVENSYNPHQNILGGAACIKSKLEEFHGDVRLALAAYNAGSGAVKRNGGEPSYCTRYINKVLSYKEAFETASSLG